MRGRSKEVPASPDIQVQLSRGATYLVLQTLGINAVTIIGFVFLARLISTSEMGIWAILLLITAACSTFVTWFPQAIIKFVAENFSRGLKSSAAAVYYQALRANLITYAPVVIAIYFGSSFLAVHLLGDISYAATLRVLSIDVFLSAGILQIVTSALLGLRKFRETAIVGFFTQGLFRQILIILLLLLMRNFIGLMIAWLISDASTVLIYMALVGRELGKPRFDFPITKMLRYYLPLEFAQIVSFAQNWFDRSFLLILVPLVTLGIYNAAVTAFGALLAVPNAMSSVLFPAFSSIQEKDSMSDAIRLATRYSTLALTPLAFGLLATAKPSLTLLVGQAYEGGTVPLVILSGALAITAFAQPLGTVLLARGETNLSALITGVTVAVAISAVYVLLPISGIVAVSSARALTLILGPTLTIFVLRRKIRLDLDLTQIAKTLVAGGVMAMVVGFVEYFEYSKFLLPLYCLVGAVVYLVMLRFLKVIDINDLRLIDRFLGRRLSLVSRALRVILLPQR